MIERGLGVLGLTRRTVLQAAGIAAMVAFPLTAYALSSRPGPTPSAPERTLLPAREASVATIGATAPPVYPSERAPAPGGCDIEHAMELWGTCDPIPRTSAAWDDALVSGRAGMLEVSTNSQMRLRIDGRDYGVRVEGGPRVTRMPIAPGAHALDLISDAYVYGRRLSVTIRAGQTQKVALDLRDELPSFADGISGRMPVLAGGSWYQGTAGGRPLFSNISDVPSGGPSGASPRPGEPGPAAPHVSPSTLSEVGPYLAPSSGKAHSPPGYRSRAVRFTF